ncbi:Golgi-associated plant pathogenesis-related protein 1-like [Actinia tenebrosa]|uniref:Golgi-associated plant pathogenesis-related protein 1-like n=1 Tax=Actinia tenebrosa TaxID=6105 RepID=A0A6P8HI24_ACTTE|nr:Golgi-associated plant pathogenesis-related protein 1-like [Actinia tenebrosa]
MFYTVVLLFGAFALSAMADYAQETLEAHNTYRKIHDAQPLSLSNDLSSSAARYARKLAGMGYLKHSPRNSRPGVGENLIYRCSSRGDPLPPSQAVKELYDEICVYDFRRPGYAMATGHFTQLVWKGSSELGVGTATSRKRGMNCLWVVFRYRKGGNITNRGYFEANVVKGSFDRRYCNRDEEIRKDEPEFTELESGDDEERP